MRLYFFPRRQVADMAKEKLKAHVDEATCCGCSLCVVNCPFDCLEISLPKKRGDIRTYAYLLKPEHCTGCKLCLKACPVDAITMMPV